MKKKTKALKRLCIWILAGMAAVALFVWVMDPFYQYHAPFFGMPTVLFDRDNQVIGSIRNLPYDSVLLGSSEAENFDSAFLDETYDCHALKVIRASGSAADLLFYLEQAHENQELTNVFWCLDLFALTGSTDVTVRSVYTPDYLFTETMLDDFTYLFNKDILFEKIPLMLAYAYTGINTGGHGYDWSDGKTFNVEMALRGYDKPAENAPEQTPDMYEARVQENIALIKEEILSHPDTQYTLFFPPYSMLWWDGIYAKGESGMYFYALKEALPALLECPNATVHYFQADENIICNLDNYMDNVHYSPAISQYILDSVVEGTYLVTSENHTEYITHMQKVFDYIVEEAIYNYY